MHACTLPVTQRMQIVFLFDNEIFRPLRFSVHSLQLLYFPASIAGLAGESKAKLSLTKSIITLSIITLPSMARKHFQSYYLQKNADLHEQILCHLLMLQH